MFAGKVSLLSLSLSLSHTHCASFSVPLVVVGVGGCSSKIDKTRIKSYKFYSYPLDNWRTMRMRMGMWCLLSCIIISVGHVPEPDPSVAPLLQLFQFSGFLLYDLAKVSNVRVLHINQHQLNFLSTIYHFPSTIHHLAFGICHFLALPSVNSASQEPTNNGHKNSLPSKVQLQENFLKLFQKKTREVWRKEGQFHRKKATNYGKPREGEGNLYVFRIKEKSRFFCNFPG